MTRRDALKAKYEAAVLDGMSLAELRQLRGNVIVWLEEWASGDGEAEMRQVLTAVETEISWRVHSLQTVGV